MQTISNRSFDAERALYGMRDLHLVNCRFTGPEDGESAVKECRHVHAEHCLCDLRYPFWHVHDLHLDQCEITENGRAALWYSDHVSIRDSRLHDIKALRECHEVDVRGCDIASDEFGWFSRNVVMQDCTVQGSYFMMQARNLTFSGVRFSGRYALQYLHDCTFTDCDITSRDAFWHAENVLVKNCVLKGEFLGWYSNHLTLDHCRILSSQPLCYCDNLTLIDCEVVDSDLCFEKSRLTATITTTVDSIKNPLSGTIELPGVDELICDDPESTARIITTGTKPASQGDHTDLTHCSRCGGTQAQAQ